MTSMCCRHVYTSSEDAEPISVRRGAKNREKEIDRDMHPIINDHLNGPLTLDSLINVAVQVHHVFSKVKEQFNSTQYHATVNVS